MSTKCKDNCAYAIFCPSFGEYKCTLKQRRIYENKETCNDYAKKTDDKERKCHCLTCVAEGYVEYEDG